MRDQTIKIKGQTPFISTIERCDRQGIIPNMRGSYWMQVYPPVIYAKAPVPGYDQLCPWDMIAEITNASTTGNRKQEILDAFRYGQQTMRLYNVPSERIIFMQEIKTGRIAIWMD